MGARHEGDDGGGADVETHGAAEDSVDEAAHKGGIEAVLGRQAGQHGVGDTLHQQMAVSLAVLPTKRNII